MALNSMKNLRHSEHGPGIIFVRGLLKVMIVVMIFSVIYLPGPVQAEAPITISDVEMEIRYLFPDGAGDAPRGYRART